MSEITCDVLIVGGGPAGLAAAIALRQRGVDVLLADAQAPPIDKPCGEGIMPDSRRELTSLGVDLPNVCGAQFNGIRFCDEHASVSAKFPSGSGLGVKRPVLHRLLIDHAAEVGVRLAWKTNVVANPGHPVVIAGRPVKYKYLVAADGQGSRLRAWAGLNNGSLLTRRFGFRIHYRIAPRSQHIGSRHVEVHWAAQGQAYVTPVADDEVCVSVMTRFPESARSREIIESIPELRERLRGAEIISRERGAITTTRRLRHVVRGNVALIGDASGSADAITGEGLAMGFRQAMLLVDAICPSHRAEDLARAEDLTRYDRLHPTVMRLPQTMARIMLLMDRFPRLRRRALRALAADPALFQTMLHVHIGEEPLRPFLLRRAPALGLRLLLPSLA